MASSWESALSRALSGTKPGPSRRLCCRRIPEWKIEFVSFEFIIRKIKNLALHFLTTWKENPKIKQAARGEDEKKHVDKIRREEMHVN